jgi:hypothetical protein
MHILFLAAKATMPTHWAEAQRPCLQARNPQSKW